MKKCAKVKLGDVVRFPHHEFAPYRNGWNGWEFRTGIVERLYTSTQGKPCAELIYLYNGKEVKCKRLVCDLFQFDTDWAKRQKREFNIDNEELRFLERHGII